MSHSSDSHGTYDHLTSDAAKPRNCAYCGGLHLNTGKCPLVSAFEYHPDGTLKRVEFHGPAPWPPTPYPLPSPDGWKIT